MMNDDNPPQRIDPICAKIPVTAYCGNNIVDQESTEQCDV